MSTEQKSDGNPEQDSCEKEASHMLEEVRMVLPGVQALFGFQLVAVYNQPFDRLLNHFEQQLHLSGMVLTAIAVALLMTPAAYHRQADPHEVTLRFLRLSSFLLTLGMFVLMLAIQVDCYLIAKVILKARLASGLIAGFLGALFFGLWFVLPRVLPRRGASDPAKITVAPS